MIIDGWAWADAEVLHACDLSCLPNYGRPPCRLLAGLVQATQHGIACQSSDQSICDSDAEALGLK